MFFASGRSAPFYCPVNHQRGKVLNVANFVFSTHTDFIEDSRRRNHWQLQVRISDDDSGVFFTPARRHRPQFTF